MCEREIRVPTSVLALLRGDLSVRCVAERFGVTEAQVAEWRDTFVVAGALALARMCAKGGESGKSFSDLTVHQTAVTTLPCPEMPPR
jgi:transposase-like protein